MGTVANWRVWTQKAFNSVLKNEQRSGDQVDFFEWGAVRNGPRHVISYSWEAMRNGLLDCQVHLFSFEFWKGEVAWPAGVGVGDERSS